MEGRESAWLPIAAICYSLLFAGRRKERHEYRVAQIFAPFHSRIQVFIFASDGGGAIRANANISFWKSCYSRIFVGLLQLNKITPSKATMNQGFVGQARRVMSFEKAPLSEEDADILLAIAAMQVHSLRPLCSSAFVIGISSTCEYSSSAISASDSSVGSLKCPSSKFPVVVGSSQWESNLDRLTEGHAKIDGSLATNIRDIRHFVLHLSDWLEDDKELKEHISGLATLSAAVAIQLTGLLTPMSPLAIGAAKPASTSAAPLSEDEEPLRKKRKEFYLWTGRRIPHNPPVLSSSCPTFRSLSAL
ncbi:hypothetical protein FB45DRAFT_861783 [Roridomyces roridus]|uniref:Uncharacterized protein n=1 Tax=Roridomyces roridus TaxID=1738132 RepID=A0AAD7FYP4_9AGAR|nr:hypothetical protein FB45DRAFT_861783 [Roridomyces roridus]